MVGERCRPRLMGHNHLFESEDLLLQVLSKLPVKTLFRFKCVCKRWRDLISDSDDLYLFLLHSEQSKCKQPLLFCSSVARNSSPGIPCSTFLESIDKEGETISEFEVKYDFSDANVVPTHFDLVCIQDDRIRICNPSTHEIITLPLPPDPLSVRYSSVGFGYGQSSNKYKVVGLLNPDYLKVEDGYSIDPASFTTKCYVFTLGIENRGSSSCASFSWAWREVVDSPYHVNYATPPAFASGAIHWLVLYNSLMDEEVFGGDMIDPNYTIVAFDVDSEEFRLVSHPEGCPDLKSLQLEYMDYECVELQLVELKGLLSLSCAKGSKMDIWMFKDYYCESDNFYISGTWEKQYSIDLNVLPKEYQIEEDFYYYTPRYVDDTEVLIETHMTGWGYYHLQSKTFEGFMHHTHMPNLRFSLYTESLRSLKLFNECTEMKDKQAKNMKALEAMSARLEDIRATCAEREDMKEALARVEDLKAEVDSLIQQW